MPNEISAPSVKSDNSHKNGESQPSSSTGSAADLSAGTFAAMQQARQEKLKQIHERAELPEAERWIDNVIYGAAGGAFGLAVKIGFPEASLLLSAMPGVISAVDASYDRTRLETANRELELLTRSFQIPKSLQSKVEADCQGSYGSNFSTYLRVAAYGLAGSYAGGRLGGPWGAAAGALFGASDGLFLSATKAQAVELSCKVDRMHQAIEKDFSVPER